METSGSTGNGHHRQHGVGERVTEISDSAQQLFSNARSAVHDINQYLDVQGRVNRNPYGMMAAAIGVGYILGGGLFTPLTARIVQLGIRLAALPLVKDELIAMAEGALNNLGQTQNQSPRTGSSDVGGVHS
jgi:hypothetical protein